MIEEDISALEERLDNLIVFSIKPEEVWTNNKGERKLMGYFPCIQILGEEIWKGEMIPVDPPKYIPSFTERAKAQQVAFSYLHSRLRSMLMDEEI